jgi:hypothetical protein
MEKLRLVHKAICVPRSQRPQADWTGKGFLTAWLELFPQVPKAGFTTAVGNSDRSQEINTAGLHHKNRTRSISRLTGE